MWAVSISSKNWLAIILLGWLFAIERAHLHYIIKLRKKGIEKILKARIQTEVSTITVKKALKKYNSHQTLCTR